jgi:hypothetical protein
MDRKRLQLFKAFCNKSIKSLKFFYRFRNWNFYFTFQLKKQLGKIIICQKFVIQEDIFEFKINKAEDLMNKNNSYKVITLSTPHW